MSRNHEILHSKTSDGTEEVQSMLAMFTILLLLLCAIVNVLSNPIFSLEQCKSGDDACFTRVVKEAFPLFLEPNPEIGAENMDPLYQPEIEGNLSILKFKLLNTTITGFKSCVVESAKYDGASSLQVNLLCDGLNLNGLYDINGRLIGLPIEGNGDYSIVTKKYRIGLNIEIKTYTGKDGKTYRRFKTYQVQPEPLEPVVFDFRNLFNGQKDLADTVLNFANENWKKVSNEVQLPVTTANFKRIIKNANKYLKTLPVGE